MDIAYLRKRIIYNKETGEMFWRQLTESLEPDEGKRKSWNTRFKGKRVGNICKRGYFTTKIKDKSLYLHRVAWAIHYGRWPNQYIDHINRNPLDNRIKNLRDCSSSVNSHNRISKRDFYRGVNFVRQCNKYEAKFKHEKIVYRLGLFERAKDAAKAYDRQARKVHGKTAITNFDEDGNGETFNE